MADSGHPDSNSSHTNSQRSSISSTETLYYNDVRHTKTSDLDAIVAVAAAIWNHDSFYQAFHQEFPEQVVRQKFES